VATRITQETNLDDIMDDPAKFGVPTFQQFLKKPEIMLGLKERVFNTVDAGSQFLNAYKIDTRFKYQKYETKKLEELQKIEEGIKFEDLKFRSQVVDQTANTLKIIVEFYSQKKSNILYGV